MKKSESLKILGERIRKQRKDVRRMTQEALALEADITPAYLSGIERGLRNPSYKILAAIAHVLQCDTAALVHDLPFDLHK